MYPPQWHPGKDLDRHYDDICRMYKIPVGEKVKPDAHPGKVEKRKPSERRVAKNDK